MSFDVKYIILLICLPSVGSVPLPDSCPQCHLQHPLHSVLYPTPPTAYLEEQDRQVHQQAFQTSHESAGSQKGNEEEDSGARHFFLLWL